MDGPAQGAADVDGRVTLDSGQKVAGSASPNPHWSELACTHGPWSLRSRRRDSLEWFCRLANGSDRVFSPDCLVGRVCRWHILPLARGVSGWLCTCICYSGGRNIGCCFRRAQLVPQSPL